MNRRRFTSLFGAALLGSLPDRTLAASLSRSATLGRARPPGARPRPPDFVVDGRRLESSLSELATFGSTAEGGTHRVAYSDEDVAAREWLTDRFLAAGLEVSVDRAANLIGRAPGDDPSLPTLMLGSHIDSVPQGGRYDGQVGSMAALEVAATLAGERYRTRHPLEYVIWANEEGGKTGSRAIVGEVDPAELDIVTASGFTIRDGTARMGGDLRDLGAARRDPGGVSAYLELHIEQGFVLDRGGVDIGVVQGIVGIRRWSVTVDGFANHAGTTPMDQRADALLAAARLIDMIHGVTRARPGTQVATVGRIQAEPGAPNVIPGRATFSLEIRDLEMDTIDLLFEDIRTAAGDIAEATRTDVAFEPFYLSRAAPTDGEIRDVIEEEADRLDYSTLRMPSGAGHDAQSIALLGPIGMIFVPSRDGISHSPLEFTAPDQIERGANVLLRTLLRLDEELNPG